MNNYSNIMSMFHIFIKLIALIIAISLSIVSWAYMYGDYIKIIAFDSSAEELLNMDSSMNKTKKDISDFIIDKMYKIFKINASWSSGEYIFIASIVWTCICIFF